MHDAPPVVTPRPATTAEAQALIAEARARARRRRIAVLAVIATAAAIGGVLAGVHAPSGSRAAAHGGPSRRPVAPVAHTGAVTGYIEPCAGIVIPRTPYAAGTVTALHGRETWQLVRSESNGTNQTYRLVLPTAVAARQHVGENQKFYFNLPPGRYVIVARYDNGGEKTYLDVSISAGRVLHRDLPDLCK